MRQCFFCSGHANSLEDAWPLWLTNQFRTPRASEVHAERRGVRLKPWRVHQPELAVRCVCRTCNNEWMSALEVQAQRCLQPLLMGERCSVDIAAQGTVAL